MSNLPDRQAAKQLVDEYIANPHLKTHCQMVATLMEAYAKKLGENEDLWYQTGLLHDLDWDKFPEEHPNKAVNELLENYPQELKQAIAAHAPARTGQEPQAKLDKYLFACDELSGFMTAYALMRPNDFEGMKPSKVKKKLKDTSFAANVSREDIAKGFHLIDEDANIDPDDHIKFLVEVLSENFEL